MKKLLLTLAALAVAPAAFAQVEIGLKVSPSITWLRTTSQDHNFQGDGARLGFGGGVFMDYFFGQNYAFNTGLFINSRGGHYTYQESPQAGQSTGETIKQKIGIDYLEIPVSLKLFTNEIAPDTRLYFQVGGTVATPIGARINGDKRYDDNYSGNPSVFTLVPTNSKASDHVFGVDFNLLGSVGTEFQLGQSTKLLAGITYHHGLIDFDRYFEKDRGFKDVSLKNSSLALDLGLKF